MDYRPKYADRGAAVRGKTVFIRRCRVILAVFSLGLATACSSTLSGSAQKESPPAATASPATVASDSVDGTYTLTYQDGVTRTWTITSCGKACAEIDQTPLPTSIRGRAELVGDSWKFEITRPDAVVCDDGSEEPGISTWIWDATSLEGWFTGYTTEMACGDPPGETGSPEHFTLERTGD